MKHDGRLHALLAPATLAALIALGGCATVPPPFAPADSGPAPRDTARSEPSSLIPTGKRSPSPAAAPRSFVPPDSLPSADAQALLSTLPEPLAPEERVPPRRRPAPAAPRDSIAVPVDQAPAAAASDSSDEGHAEAPVPSPTQPLGDRPGALERMLAADSTAAADSSARARSASGANARTAAPAPASPTGAAADTCFRVQVGAPAEVSRANQLRDAATSQLLVPMVVEKERGLFKVRTRECYSRAAADRLRERAMGAGFHGVFRISGKRPEPHR
jgi:DedD protein